MIELSVINNSRNELPRYETSQSAGVDLRADIEVNKSVTIKPLERKLIGTGLKIALPEGFEAQIRPRSGLALKNGITVLNTPGTIDADYRGEIKVVLINLSNEDFTVNNGDRIAQMIVNKYEQVEFKIVDNLDVTERGAGGYGHTGV
jgi:dUTP pyrophosphatase